MRYIYRCLCFVLGSILGSGCDSDSVDPVEYGQPHGKVRLDGRVQDEDGHSIAGIQVAFDGSRPDTTGSDGTWSISDSFAAVHCARGGTPGCVLHSIDIDGPDNGGSFAPAEVPLDLVQTEDGEGWYQGAFEQHGIVVVLREKKDDGKDESESWRP